VFLVATACHPPNDIDGQRTAALGAIEGDEPSLTTVVAVQIKVSLINNTESSVIFPLVENTILQNTKARMCMDTDLNPRWRKMWYLNCFCLMRLFC